MNKKLIGVYELRIFRDGTIETKVKSKEKGGESNIEATNSHESNKIKGSSRITQILQVIEISLDGLQNEDIVDEVVCKRIVTKAVKSVADTFEVFETTVRDKINRQIELSHSQFVQMLIEFHSSKGQDNTLENHILKYLSNRTFDEDEVLVKESFNRFRKAYKQI